MHCSDRSIALLICLHFFKQRMCNLIAECIGYNNYHSILWVIDVPCKEISLQRKSCFSICVCKLIVPVHCNPIQILIRIDILNQFPDFFKLCGIFQFIKVKIKVSIITVNLISWLRIFLNQVFDTADWLILTFSNHIKGILKNKILIAEVLSKMLLPAFYTKFRNRLSIQLCSYILILKSADNPTNQKFINTCKDIASYKCFHFHLLKIIFTVDCIVDNLWNLIKTCTI